jgi:hypothetical protein
VRKIRHQYQYRSVCYTKSPTAIKLTIASYVLGNTSFKELKAHAEMRKGVKVERKQKLTMVSATSEIPVPAGTRI